VTLEQSQHGEKEAEMRQEKRALKVDLKEMELAHQEAVKTLKMVRRKTLLHWGLQS